MPMWVVLVEQTGEEEYCKGSLLWEYSDFDEKERMIISIVLAIAIYASYVPFPPDKKGMEGSPSGHPPTPPPPLKSKG